MFGISERKNLYEQNYLFFYENYCRLLSNVALVFFENKIFSIVPNTLIHVVVFASERASCVCRQACKAFYTRLYSDAAYTFAENSPQKIKAHNLACIYLTASIFQSPPPPGEKRIEIFNIYKVNPRVFRPFSVAVCVGCLAQICIVFLLLLHRIIELDACSNWVSFHIDWRAK